MLCPGGDGSPVQPILGPPKRVYVSNPVKCEDLTGFYQPSNNKLDFGGGVVSGFCEGQVFALCFLKKERKIMHGF
jgi:hypothetical protein